jgi:hypothetical protein
MWLMDSKQKIYYKVWHDNFIQGLKQVYNKNILANGLKETFYQLKTSSNKITCIGLIDNEIIVFDNTITNCSFYRNLLLNMKKEFDKPKG